MKTAILKQRKSETKIRRSVSNASPYARKNHGAKFIIQLILPSRIPTVFYKAKFIFYNIIFYFIYFKINFNNRLNGYYLQF